MQLHWPRLCLSTLNGGSAQLRSCTRFCQAVWVHVGCVAGANATAATNKSRLTVSQHSELEMARRRAEKFAEGKRANASAARYTTPLSMPTGRLDTDKLLT